MQGRGGLNCATAFEFVCDWFWLKKMLTIFPSCSKLSRVSNSSLEDFQWSQTLNKVGFSHCPGDEDGGFSSRSPDEHSGCPVRSMAVSVDFDSSSVNREEEEDSIGGLGLRWESGGMCE